REPQVRGTAALCLASLAKEATIPSGELVRVLKNDEDQSARGAAAYALGEIGQPNGEVTDALVAALMGTDRDVRGVMARALGKLHPTSIRTIEGLIGALGDREKEVRQEAAAALGQIGPPAAPAIPQLERLLKDDAWLVVFSAAYALWHIESKDEVAVD